MYGSCVARSYRRRLHCCECKADKENMLFEVPHVSNLLEHVVECWKLNGIADKCVQHVGSIVKFKSYWLRVKSARFRVVRAFVFQPSPKLPIDATFRAPKDREKKALLPATPLKSFSCPLKRSNHKWNNKHRTRL